MTERGWGTSEMGLLTIRFLDWVAERNDGGDVVHPAIAFYGDEQESVTSDQSKALVDAVKDLESLGLIDGQRMQVGWIGFYASLTPQGRRAVIERNERRQSRRARSVAARDAMLDWMYENTSEASGEAPEIEEFVGTVHAHFEGDPFSASEITEAAEHLRDEKYITGIEVWGPPLIRPKVTSKGRRAVESDRYTAEPEQGTSTINSVTIGGDNLGQAGAGHMTQQQSNGVDAATFAVLVGDLRGALAELSEGDKARASAYVEMIEGEVKSEQPNSRVLDVARDGLKTVGDRITNRAFDAGADALWVYVASRLGLSTGA